MPGRVRCGHAEVGVRHRAAAGARDQADPRQLGAGRVGARHGRARAHARPARGLLQAAGGVGAVTMADRLAELGVALPPVPVPVAAYVPAVRTGDLVYTSGQLPIVAGELVATGRVGAEVRTEDAVAAARTCALNALAAVDALVGLDAVRRVV